MVTPTPSVPPDVLHTKRAPSEAEVAARNQALAAIALDGYPMRLPGLVATLFFYYKLVSAKKFTLGMHVHGHWEITRISHGIARYGMPGRAEPVIPTSGGYLVIPAEQQHEWRMEKGPLLLHSFQMKLKAVDEHGKRLAARLTQAAAQKHFVLESSRAQDEAEAILWQVAGGGYPSELLGSMVSGCLQIILAELLARLVPWKAPQAVPVADFGKPREVVATRIISFIEENIGHPLTLSHLESHFHYSARHLNRLFRSQFGMPVGHYLRQRRMELARQLLATTGKPIKEIALSLGYGSIAQFGRYFAGQEGMTPTEYRNARATGRIKGPG